MIVYRLEHTHCPNKKPGHGPATGAPLGCNRIQKFGRHHCAPADDPLVPERVEEEPCYACQGVGDNDWGGKCWNCEGRRRARVTIRITPEQVCGVTREQLPSWAVTGCEPNLIDGWEVIVYRVDGRFRYTRRGLYQVVFRREDADVVGRITTNEQLKPLLQLPTSGERLDTAPRQAA